MATNTSIEWTDATWNPIRGCSRVSEGCKHCYAERVAARFSGDIDLGNGRSMADAYKKPMPYDGLAIMRSDGPHWTGEVRFIEEHLTDPIRWKKPRRIFVNSMSDLFHEKVPVEWILKIIDVMQEAKQHTFQILTKRPERMEDVLNTVFKGLSDPGSNMWWGVSVEDQKTADERIPLLLETPAAIRWVSYEPALQPVDFTGYLPHYPNGRCKHAKLDWLVVGGESGPGARPFNIQWARDVIAQCKVVGVPCFVKQLGARVQKSGFEMFDVYGGGKASDPSKWPEDLRVREYPRERNVNGL